MYKIQWALSKPVSQMPAKTTIDVVRNTMRCAVTSFSFMVGYVICLMASKNGLSMFSPDFFSIS